MLIKPDKEVKMVTSNFFETYLGAKSNDGYHNKTTGFKSYFLFSEDGARLEIMNKPRMLADFPLIQF